MTFKEFSHAVRQNARLTELINRYDDDPLAMSDEEVQEMVDLSAAISDEANEYDPFDCSEESNVDLFGPWWE